MSLIHPLADADSLVNVPLGAWLDLSYLVSLQVVISHNLMTGEVWYQYQSRVIFLDVPAAGSSQILGPTRLSLTAWGSVSR